MLLFINIADVTANQEHGHRSRDLIKWRRRRSIIYANASEFRTVELVGVRGKITLLRIYLSVNFAIPGIRMFYIYSDLWRFMKYLRNLTFGCSRKPKLWLTVSGKWVDRLPYFKHRAVASSLLWLVRKFHKNRIIHFAVVIIFPTLVCPPQPKMVAPMTRHVKCNFQRV